MPPVKIRCPTCAREYPLDEQHLGKKVRCKKCSTTFTAVQIDRPGGADRPRGADGIYLDWEPGDVVLDVYEVRPLSDTKKYEEGGMGRVNRVWHRGQQRWLAVKSVKPEHLKKAGALENFKREAEVWVDKIGRHPHLVFCEYVRVLGDLPRVFVEFVDGGSLAEWIRSGKLYEGGPEAALSRILDVTIQFAWALEYVHERGLVHQDVKPRNVMMTQSGVAKLTDFGLTRARAVSALGVEAGSLLPDVTRLSGTSSYQSPEQAGGERLTAATDVWSWGVSILDLFFGDVADVEHRAGLEALTYLEDYAAGKVKAQRQPRMPAPRGVVASVLPGAAGKPAFEPERDRRGSPRGLEGERLRPRQGLRRGRPQRRHRRRRPIRHPSVTVP